MIIPEATSIEQLITECSFNETESLYRRIFTELCGREVYINCFLPAQGISELPQIETYMIGPIRRCLGVFTSKNNKQIKTPFAGMRWEDVCKMVLDDMDMGGVSVANLLNDWVAYDRDNLSNMLTN